MTPFEIFLAEIAKEDPAAPKRRYVRNGPNWYQRNKHDPEFRKRWAERSRLIRASKVKDAAYVAKRAVENKKYYEKKKAEKAK